MLLENESLPEDTRVLLEATTLTEVGYDVTVVCPTGSRKSWREQIDGVRVYRYPAPWEISGFVGYVAEFAYSMFMAFIYASFILLRHGFDVIHVHMPPDMNALVGLCFRLVGKRMVIDHHDLSPEMYQAQQGGQGSRLVERALLGFERVACRSAEQLIATNESQRRIQIERCDADPQRCHVVRNGPNEQFLGEVKPLPQLADDPRCLLGYIGMIGFQDGVDYLIESLVELKSRRTDFLAVVVGDGPALRGLKELVHERSLGDFVRFTGLVEFVDVPRYIASFDICVTPDPSNAYNDSCTTIKTIEYMALGKPTVAFATRENRITAGEAALYAQNNDVAQFADLIEKLMDDEELRTSMGEIGRRRVEASLAWEHQRKKLVAFYNELFAEPTSRAKPASVRAPSEGDGSRATSA
ncbi:MAG: glycosyltransferase family 4 protein [Candidatus Tectomicrobia bacterium]|nr:glycosyltransferase family 4 protein [Candidatus Tectomicrobia bacterium]